MSVYEYRRKYFWVRWADHPEWGYIVAGIEEDYPDEVIISGMEETYTASEFTDWIGPIDPPVSGTGSP